MPLFTRSFQELITDSVEELARTTNITKLSAGGKARSILETVNRRIEETHESFDINLARAFVSSSSGQFLDLIGELLGVTRELAHAASATEEARIMKFSVQNGATFGSINNNGDIFIPAGERISTEPNEGGAVYRIIQDKLLKATDTEDYVAIESISPGEESNVGTGALTHHTFTNYADSDNRTLIATNLHPIANGKNLESDANYRFRIVNRVLEAEAGNQTAIRLAALSTPGVADVLLIKHYRGIGTFGVIIKSITPTVTNQLIENVKANIAKATSFGDIAFVRGPKETGLTFRITVHYSNRLSEDALSFTEDLITEAITNFVNNLDLGEAFEFNRLVAELFDIDAEIANFGKPGKPIDEMFIHKESRTKDTKQRAKLLGDYFPENDERVIIEPGVQNPIELSRAFTRR